MKYFYGHSSPTVDSRSVVVSYKQKYVHTVLVKCLVKLAQEKVCLGDLIIMTITVDLDVKPQSSKQNK